MKKFIAMMMIVSVFAGILAGCGGEKTDEAAAPAAETAGTPAEKPAETTTGE